MTQYIMVHYNDIQIKWKKNSIIFCVKYKASTAFWDLKSTADVFDEKNKISALDCHKLFTLLRYDSL